MAEKAGSTARPQTISSQLLRNIGKRLRSGQPVRRRLPRWGRVHIDRPLPFLCIYRRPARRKDAGTERLATSEASYLTCMGSKNLQEGFGELVWTISKAMTEQFGACLLLEIWSGPSAKEEGPVASGQLTPEFRLFAPRDEAGGDMSDEFTEALSRIRLGKRKAVVKRSASSRCAPRGLPPLLSPERAEELGCRVYGLEIAPIYRDPTSGRLFPQVLRTLRHQLTVALRRTFFEFARKNTTHRPPHYHAMGRRAVVKAVWEVDRILAEASEQFDFLLQLTPINADQAWQEFRRNDYRRKPVFHYRPLPAEPVVLKRNLYRAPVERVEDPALAQLFREKIDEIDRQITMMQDRNSPRFLHGSIQLYGDVDEDLLTLARRILDAIPPHSRDERGRDHLNAEQFAARARTECRDLQKRWPSATPSVEILPDVTGLMVSRNRLLISRKLKIPASRADALLQHEIGTHLLTYFNGRAQRFRQLYTGLAGYDALQEGLAVLAEYLVDGLSRPRMRLLAGRVVACRALLDRASFVETFRLLTKTHGFAQRTAFDLTMRVYRAGGLTKDAVYLRGLVQILDYLAHGGEMEPLFAGKVAVQHVPIVRELQWRGILREPPLTPLYLDRPEAILRLEALRQGLSPLDLVTKRRTP